MMNRGSNMTIREIVDKIEGKVLSCEDRLSTEIEYAFSSDPIGTAFMFVPR